MMELFNMYWNKLYLNMILISYATVTLELIATHTGENRGECEECWERERVHVAEQYRFHVFVLPSPANGTGTLVPLRHTRELAFSIRQTRDYRTRY